MQFPEPCTTVVLVCMFTSLYSISMSYYSPVSLATQREMPALSKFLNSDMRARAFSKMRGFQWKEAHRRSTLQLFAFARRPAVWPTLCAGRSDVIPSLLFLLLQLEAARAGAGEISCLEDKGASLGCPAPSCTNQAPAKTHLDPKRRRSAVEERGQGWCTVSLFLAAARPHRWRPQRPVSAAKEAPPAAMRSARLARMEERARPPACLYEQ